SPDASTPDAAFREVTQFFAVDHAEGRLYACLSLPLRATEAHKEAGIRMLAAIADRAAQHVAKATSPVSSDPVTFAFRHDPLNYIDLIRACRDEIKAGESYELCLTNIISTEARFDAWAFYKLLRERNPSIYGGYLNIGGTEVASSSPERFLRLKRDNILESKPIKGTAPRGTTEAMDRTLKQELRDSEKERAENIMIVDLVRHDFSGVAVPGSIEVPNLCNIESYPAVHQMVSTVQARLRPDLSTADALRACFPGGSMTGAPKIRSVQILDRLENGPRGVYSGALGWVGYDGQLDLSIVIRTLVKQGGVSSIGCGGAITYLSDPAAELDEIMTKSRALVRTLSELITGDPENHVFIPSKQQDPTAPDTAFVRAE
ncbi:MAG: aminodeoxychorismate synthase component I, partial [Pseudomonadota bacterium]